MAALDAFDLRLLELLQRNSQLSQGDLGRQIHLSTAAVNRRLKRLLAQASSASTAPSCRRRPWATP